MQNRDSIGVRNSVFLCFVINFSHFKRCFEKRRMHDSNIDLISKICLTRSSRTAIFAHDRHLEIDVADEALRVLVVEGESTSAVDFCADKFDRSLKCLN